MTDRARIVLNILKRLYNALVHLSPHVSRHIHLIRRVWGHKERIDLLSVDKGAAPLAQVRLDLQPEKHILCTSYIKD